MLVEKLAKLDGIVRGPLIQFLPPHASTKFYSWGRKHFLQRFSSAVPNHYNPPQTFARKLWGIDFRSPLFNGAGMYKNGEAYSWVAAEGAGAYLAGTTTSNARPGNQKNGIHLAFCPYPRSRSASNWLGLPNDGDEAIAERLAAIQRVPGCPVGVSTMGSPDFQGDAKLEAILKGLLLFRKARVDFIELNESCPNTAHGKPQDDDLKRRLEYLSDHFIKGEPRIPIIVKFSNDTPLEQVPDLLAMLIDLGFDGVNFGNTSVNYAKHRDSILPPERRCYDHFTSTFGGGVSGRALKNDSLRLVRVASNYLEQSRPTREFHIVRAGGVETADDVLESLAAGASLVEWYTGYFENFAVHGCDTYRVILEKAASVRQSTHTGSADASGLAKSHVPVSPDTALPT